MAKQDAAAHAVVRAARNLLTERAMYGEAHKSFYDELRISVKKYDAAAAGEKRSPPVGRRPQRAR